ncbi:MAG: hypothetical protein KGJ45_11660, partial [Elusimicrobia bacterium]|nr:hypothetical protein [Elusimicrobiota bacterium]
MGSPFAIDQLNIINDALLATGNQPVTQIADGSDEWTAASNFYDRALRETLIQHDWKFTLTLGAMTRVGSSSYPGYQDMYQPPADCLQLRECYDERVAALIQPIDTWTISKEGIKLPPMDYRLLNGLVHCIAPEGAGCLYLQNPANETGFTVGFAAAVTRLLEQYLYQGFNEDPQAAVAIEKKVQEKLEMARMQDDETEPRRLPFRSGMLE